MDEECSAAHILDFRIKRYEKVLVNSILWIGEAFTEVK